MEAAATAGRGVSLSQSQSRKQWRAVSEHSLRNASSEDLERSKLGQSDERTIYEVQQEQEPIDGVDFCSVQMDGIMDMDDGIVQQRIHNLVRQREEMQQMEIELRAQLIVKAEIVDMQNSFDAQLKEQANVVVRLQEQLQEREQSMHELERKMEEKDRELHAVRLDNEAAWAKEDLLREQNKEIANFRRERDNIEAERAHHRKQIHDLQEHIQDKERQMLELQEQNRVAQETILYKDEQIREAQAWMTRVQEIDVLQSSTLQAELRERIEQYNQLWLGCQRQFAEMERQHMQAIQQLQLELAGVRGNGGTYSSEPQNTSSDGSHIVPNSGNHVEANGGDTSSANLSNGNSENAQSYVSSGNASTQANHAPSLSLTPPSILGMPSYLPPGQVTAMHPYIMHQQGANHSVASQVPQSHVGHFQSVQAMASLQQWQSQQAVPEGPMPSQNQYSLSQTEENPSRTDPSYSYEYSVGGQTLHPDYLNAHISQGTDPNCQISSNEVAQTLESVEKSYFVGHDTQHSLQQISAQFQEALRLDSVNQASEIKTDDNVAGNISNNELESQDAVTEHSSSVAGPSPSESSVHSLHFSESTMNNSGDAVLSEAFVSTEQANGLPTGKIPEPSLLDERALLASIVRTIPAGGKIRISSTLPNRLGKMLAPLHWHDYKRKYGKLDDFVSSHPELFLIEGDYIQLREGAQGIIAATTAVAKVAAAAAASSPYSPFFPPVAVTPMAHAGRAKKLSSLEPKLMRNSADSTHSSAMHNHHSNGTGYVSGSLANVKILSKTKDSLELNGPEFRSGQPLLVPAENGAHSDRSILGNPQSQVPLHARGSSNYGPKQQGRTAASALASRR
ncbi:Angiomotin-like protein 1 [Bienertia sinuspersici]